MNPANSHRDFVVTAAQHARLFVNHRLFVTAVRLRSRLRVAKKLSRTTAETRRLKCDAIFWDANKTRSVANRTSTFFFLHRLNNFRTRMYVTSQPIYTMFGRWRARIFYYSEIVSKTLPAWLCRSLNELNVRITRTHTINV